MTKVMDDWNGGISRALPISMTGSTQWNGIQQVFRLERRTLVPGNTVRRELDRVEFDGSFGYHQRAETDTNLSGSS